jgi:NifB/MoaA-like Fe-S oxidoreductase
MDQLRRLADGGISFHCQMVIVPGLNDGAVLEESLADLWSLGAAALSVAVVPVGLTQFSHLYSGESMAQGDAARLLDQIACWSRRASVERGSHWVYGSDELYLLASRQLPHAAHYGDFPQIENGVGAVAWLRNRVAEGAGRLPRMEGKRIAVVTGTSMRTVMPDILRALGMATGADFEMISVENSLFGRTTTVAGLLVSADLRNALESRKDIDVALIPAETINDSGVFLDDVPFPELASSLPVPVMPSYDFVDVLAADPLDIFSRRLSGAIR